MNEVLVLSRNLVISDEINCVTVKELITRILDINSEDNKREQDLNNYTREPIQIVINSPGGSFYDGAALVGAIEQSVTPIYTVCLGMAMSMGLMVLLGGSKRFIHRFGTILYHEACCGTYDKIAGVKQNLVEGERIQAIYDNYILDNTNITKDKLEDVKMKKLDWFISADEALKLGIVDGVIELS